MSEYIPYEIQEQIIKRLPVKSLLKFRSVSKPWKSLSEFITGYNVPQTQPHRLLVWYNEVDTYEKYVSFFDYNTFAQQEFAHTVPELAKLHNNPRVVGTSHGLLCLYDDSHNQFWHTSGMMVIVLWNPSIRKSVGIALPGLFGLETILGFGVCPITSDPTIVKIDMWWGMGDETSVQVFSLRAGSWRTLSGSLPDKLINITSLQVSIYRFIYWFASKTVDIDSNFSSKKIIMSFDMISHEFRVRGVDLPDSLSGQFCNMSKISESLAVLKWSTVSNKQFYDVWMMDHNVPNTFTKLFTINPPDGFMKTVSFTENGVEMRDDYIEEQRVSLLVYDPHSGVIKDVGIYGNYDSFYVGSYMETLLLLNESDCSVYDEKGVSKYPNQARNPQLER